MNQCSVTQVSLDKEGVRTASCRSDNTMKPSLLRFTLFVLYGLFLCPPAAPASSPPADSIHFCAFDDYEQWRRDHPRPAAKRLADLNAGEPRTVRMIYFLPNDRPYRQEVVDSMKVVIRRVQTFYAEQMDAHGYGIRTFHFETDPRGEPLVHRVDGQQPTSHYDNTYAAATLDEIMQSFDLDQNIYLIVIDNGKYSVGDSAGRGRRRGKMVDMHGSLATLAGNWWSMNWATPSDYSTISAMVHTSCRTVRAGLGYPRALPSFWLCTPTSIPIAQFERGSRPPSNSFRRLDIRLAHRASPSNSKSAIQRVFTRWSCSFQASPILN